MTPSALLLWALGGDAGLDGYRPTTEAVTDALKQACEGGATLACEPDALRAGGHYDPTHPPKATCSPATPVGCVLVGWAGSRDAGGETIADTVDPARARAAREAFRTACDAGVARGCTELGRTYLDGFASYTSDAMARSLLSSACEAGEAQACRLLGTRLGDDRGLSRAIELGHPAALADRALGREERDPAEIEQACEQGAASACDALDRVERACELGLEDACVTSLLTTARAEERDPADVATLLDARCATSARACREAAFLRDGSPIIPRDGGSYPTDREIDRWIYDLNEPLRQCLLGGLKRDPKAERWLDIAFRIGADGHIAATWTPETEVDPELTACVRGVFREARFRAPTPGTLGDPTMTVVRRIPLFVSARVDVHSDDDGPTVGADVTSVTSQLTALGDELDSCVVDHDDPRYVDGGELQAFVNGKGLLKRFSWLSMDVEPDARSCLEDVLERPLPEPPARSLYITAALRFLQRADGPPEIVIPEPFPPLDPPVELRTLAIVVEKSDIDGLEGAVGPESLASVKALHEELDQRVRAMTHGSLGLHTDVASWPEVLRAGGVTREVEVLDPEEEIEEEVPRLRLDAYEMPDELGTLLGEGHWDLIFLWVPITLEDGRAIHGTTWPSETLRGATFSVIGFPSGGTVAGRATSPAWEVALHELYHQLEARADHLLGVELPSNHALLTTVDGEVLSPRTYVREGTGEAFYEEVLGRRIHPEVWRDLTLRAAEDVVEPGDLALRAEPIRKGGARNADVLTDGLRSLGDFHDTSTLDLSRPSDDAGWWGLRFQAEVPVARVVARLASGPYDEPTVKRVAIEGLNSTAWEPLAEVDVKGPTVDVTLDPETWDGVRVRVLERVPDREPACAEIEVYPPAAGG
ncbi:MAG: sel1 repeat family protein [Alphaproteobacteria bacterium]|nr:sel1 repeat family protein [Alphaproteobacteria bacterium]MCB9696444.1 sel1 repeat family protein [Alphaproteobacteria bacterium]